MSWSSRRQLLYFFYFLVIIAVIVGLFVHKTTTTVPTCLDHKQNGAETGVDCGGGCQQYCPDQLPDPKVRWSRIFTVAPGVVHAIAYIEHSNPGAASRAASYEFKLYDDKNNLVATRDGTTFIGPFGRTAIVETLISVGNTNPVTVQFSFTQPVPWEKIPSSFSSVVIKTDRQLLESIPQGTRLTVTLENQSRFAFADMDIVAILYDKDDNAIAVSKSFLASLDAQGNATVYFTWPQEFKDQTARVEVIPRFNPFNAQAL